MNAKRVQKRTVTCRRIEGVYPDKFEVIFAMKLSGSYNGKPCVQKACIFNKATFENKDAVQIWCDAAGLKLVSIDEFNELFDLNVVGDEC